MFSLLLVLLVVDMQAHIASDEGKAAYTSYIKKQNAYYSGSFAPETLLTLTDTVLFERLNTLMGNTCLLTTGSYSYNKLRDYYVSVDKDLNTTGNIIGYYDGKSMNGEWDSGKTYNREHTWPQSKGADKSIPMVYDMQSVRPASAAANSNRGNDAYGEAKSYWDPNTIAINNTYYNVTNLGTYRGDAARVILYDYVVYGEAAPAPSGTAGGGSPAASSAPAPAAGSGEDILAPLEGKFYRVKDAQETPKNVGDHVEAGDVIGYIEAMKTYNAIRADFAGTITAILVNSGDSVEEDDPIMKIAK